MSDLKVFLELGDQHLDVRPGANTLGRSRRCDVVVPDGSISRNHALLSLTGDRATLQDLESSNGTYLNGWRLVGEVDLADGDLVMLGETELRVRIVREGEAPSVPRPRPYSDLPSRSEAIAVGDVFPVGDVLASPTGSRELTGPLDVSYEARDSAASVSSAATPTKGVLVQFPSLGGTPLARGKERAEPPVAAAERVRPEPPLPSSLTPPPSNLASGRLASSKLEIPPAPTPVASMPSRGAEPAQGAPSSGELLPSIDDLDRILQPDVTPGPSDSARRGGSKSSLFERLGSIFRRR